MKHLDQLLDELQKPIAQLMDWCKEDQDRAIVACIEDLLTETSSRLFEVLSEVYPDLSASGLIDVAAELSEIIGGYIPMHEVDCERLYMPLEHIINDRIDLYNRS